MKNECWKDVLGYKDFYQISDFGRVRSLRRNIIMSPGNTHGYQFVRLWKNSKVKNFYVHRLVAKHFLLNPGNKEEVNHKNSIRGDNIVSNLEWCTHKENIKHGHTEGYMYQEGKFNHMCKFSKEIVNEMRQLRLAGIKLKDIAEKFDSSESHVCWICKNKYRKVL